MLGGIVKTLLPENRGGQPTQKYKSVLVESLPMGANAGGFRPGAANELAATVPLEHATHVTGHDFPGNINFYIDASRALSISGARVLAGWTPVPWGQLGLAPVPPSLDALADNGRLPLAPKTALQTRMCARGFLYKGKGVLAYAPMHN